VTPETKEEDDCKPLKNDVEEVVREEWIKPELSSISTKLTLTDDGGPS